MNSSIMIIHVITELLSPRRSSNKHIVSNVLILLFYFCMTGSSKLALSDGVHALIHLIATVELLFQMIVTPDGPEGP